MTLNEQTAEQILDFSRRIFEKVEQNTPQMILKQPSQFLDWEDNNSYYYFEYPKVDGAIIRKENGVDYCVQSTVQYINTDGKPCGFAKIRIYEEDSKIKIKGKRTGYCFSSDCDDDDFSEKPDPDLPLVLETMKINLCALLDEIEKDTRIAVDTYDPRWVKQLIRNHNKNA